MSGTLLPAFLLAGLFGVFGGRPATAANETTNVGGSTVSLIKLASTAEQASEATRLLVSCLAGANAELVLATTEASSAWEIAESVRAQVQRSLLALDTKDIAVNVGIGLARLVDLGEPAPATVHALLARTIHEYA